MSRAGSTHPLAPSLPQKDAGKRGKESQKAEALKNSQKAEARSQKGPGPAPAWGNQIGDGWKKLFAPGAGRKNGSFPKVSRRKGPSPARGQVRKTIHAKLRSKKYDAVRTAA